MLSVVKSTNNQYVKYKHQTREREIENQRNQKYLNMSKSLYLHRS